MKKVLLSLCLLLVTVGMCYAGDKIANASLPTTTTILLDNNMPMNIYVSYPGTEKEKTIGAHTEMNNLVVSNTSYADTKDHQHILTPLLITTVAPSKQAQTGNFALYNFDTDVSTSPATTSITKVCGDLTAQIGWELTDYTADCLTLVFSVNGFNGHKATL